MAATNIPTIEHPLAALFRRNKRSGFVSTVYADGNPVKKLTDAELLQAITADSILRDAAFAEIYRRHSARVHRYCVRYLNDRDWGEDVFQETFIRFYQALLSGREVRNAAAYLLRIARNLCHNAKRDSPEEAIRVEMLELCADETRDDMTELAQLAVVALELLPEEQKESLLLQVYGGLSYAEIAEELGVPLTTVRNWIARGKRRLREVLSKRFEEYRG